MTGNALARACFVLFGAYLIVSFFDGLVGTIMSMMESHARIGMEIQSEFIDPYESFLEYFAFALLTGAVSGLLFQIAPGYFLISRSRDWANRLVPPADEAASYIEFTALLRVGLTLLGYYFLIFGLGSLLGFVLTAGTAVAFDMETLPRSLPSLAYSVVYLAAAYVLIASARRAA